MEWADFRMVLIFRKSVRKLQKNCFFFVRRTFKFLENLSKKLNSSILLARQFFNFDVLMRDVIYNFKKLKF